MVALLFTFASPPPPSRGDRGVNTLITNDFPHLQQF